jgi:hypothetical protein
MFKIEKNTFVKYTHLSALPYLTRRRLVNGITGSGDGKNTRK